MIRLLQIFLLLSISSLSFANVFPPAPGERYDVGGYKIHIHCQGQGSPTVIVDVGLGDDSTDWLPVLAGVSKNSRICVFDRPGYGWSDFGPQPRNSLRIAYELETLLAKAEIKPPYVMVGHSFGGYNIRVFTANHPDKVTGMVLVDASHEDQYERFDINLPQNYNRRSNILVLPKSSGDESHMNKPKVLRERAFHAARAEISSLSQSALQVQQLPKMPNIPLVIVSRGKAEWFGELSQQARENTWTDMQQELYLLSSKSQHVFANESGHDIPQSQPKIIIDAINNVIQQARSLNSED
ncbi:MAG TPA: alpha/beta hydrolase [Methylophaga sp.]|nr:alpha/beta hydrolase [Methylophaga sp.]